MAAEIQYAIGLVNVAESLIKKYHYSHRMVTPSFVVTAHLSRSTGFTNMLGSHASGWLGDPVAAIVFSRPSGRNWVVPVLELSRLVRKEGVDIPLSQLVSRSVRMLKASGMKLSSRGEHKQRTESLVDLLISYADNTQGHHGGIYQACSWSYHGMLPPNTDGFVINGVFMPRRSVNGKYSTSGRVGLRGRVGRLGQTDIVVEHKDKGKFLYWKALSPSGRKSAAKAGLAHNPYPKPDHVTNESVE